MLGAAVTWVFYQSQQIEEERLAELPEGTPPGIQKLVADNHCTSVDLIGCKLDRSKYPFASDTTSMQILGGADAQEHFAYAPLTRAAASIDNPALAEDPQFKEELKPYLAASKELQIRPNQSERTVTVISDLGADWAVSHYSPDTDVLVFTVSFDSMQAAEAFIQEANYFP